MSQRTADAFHEQHEMQVVGGARCEVRHEVRGEVACVLGLGVAEKTSRRRIGYLGQSAGLAPIMTVASSSAELATRAANPPQVKILAARGAWRSLVSISR